MSDMHISNRRFWEARGTYRLIRNWDWDYFVTLTFSPKDRRLSSYYARRRLERWIFRLSQRTNMQIGCFFILCYRYGELHIHALLLGRGEENGETKTLKKIPKGTINKSWFRLMNLEVPESQEAVARYIAAHHFSHKCHRAIIDTINPEFLSTQRQ